jgi:hypothetical protein
MSKRERTNRKKSSKSKIVLIIVLVGVLIAVTYFQFAEMIPGSAPEGDQVQTSEPSERKPRRLPIVPGRTAQAPASVAPVATNASVPMPTNVSRTTSTVNRAETFTAVPDTPTAWPAASLAVISQQDPFQVPAELKRMEQQRKTKLLNEQLSAELAARRAEVEAERARILAVVARFKAKGVELTFIQENRRVAKIDGKIVREGDVIDGLRVVQINENGGVIVDVPNWPADVPDLPEIAVSETPAIP